jgi:hypothetical protein
MARTVAGFVEAPGVTSPPTGYPPGVLLYGEAPPTGETTLDMRRHPLPPGPEAGATARTHLERILEAWGWDDWVAPADQCVSEVLSALADEEPTAIELWAYRRAKQVTLELQYHGTARFHQLLGSQRERALAIAMVDDLVPLWGVRPCGDGEAIWFELR